MNLLSDFPLALLVFHAVRLLAIVSTLPYILLSAWG